MRISVTVTVRTGGLDALARVGTLLRAIVDKVAADTLAHAIKLVLSGSKSGRIYKRKGRYHTASAPGEAPASDMGNLVNSGYVRPLPGDGVFSGVGFHAFYARILELRKNRPFLLPALDATATKKLPAAIRRAIHEAVRRASRG